MATAPSNRTRLRRKPDRARYDRETVYSILDEGLVCHLAFLLDGQPTAIPTTYGRLGDRLYIHGSRTNRALKALARGVDACVEVTLLDAIVAGRSPMRHSMNYRSVVVYGCFAEVTAKPDKLNAVGAILDHVVPERREALRAPTQRELTQTRFLYISLHESSAKIRSGPPNADPDDDLLVWSGVLPLLVQSLPPLPADAAARELTPPRGIGDWSHGKGALSV